MINWFKKLRSIVKDYDNDISRLHNQIQTAENFIRDKTTVNADVCHDGANQIIVIGQYKNVDYVQVFSLQGRDFNSFIDHLRELRKYYGRLNRIDAPQSMKTVIKRDVGWS